MTTGLSRTEKAGRIVVAAWLIGFVVAAGIQLFFQVPFASQTIWGFARGWQTEIGLWNVGLSLILIGLLRSNLEFSRHVIPGITVLGIAFGINHLQAGLSSLGFNHWVGFGANLAGVACSCAYYIFRPKDQPARN